MKFFAGLKVFTDVFKYLAGGGPEGWWEVT